jgi:hypothetical protein
MQDKIIKILGEKMDEKFLLLDKKGISKMWSKAKGIKKTINRSDFRKMSKLLHDSKSLRNKRTKVNT